MKAFGLILSFFLSLLFGGKADDVVSEPGADGQYSIAEAPSKDNTADLTRNREICITAAQGYSFAGGDSTHSVSVRINSGGRRITPQTKSSFRVIKGGKVIDNNHEHPFLAQPFVHQAGVFLPERYLFSLCRLRL